MSAPAEEEGFSVEFPRPAKPSERGRWGKVPAGVAVPSEDGETFTLEQQKPEVLPDVLKSVASQGALGLVADTAGLTGSLGQLYDMAARAMMKHGVLPGAEALGVLPQGYGNKFLAERDARKTQAERDGDVNTIFGIPVPTSQGAEKLLRKHLPNLGLDYEPKTTEGKFAGSAARFAGSSLIPGMGVGATVAKRALLGAAAGAGSEAAGRVGEQFGMEGLGRVAGALAVPAAISGLGALAKPIVKPAEAAREKVVAALAKDSNRGSNVTPQGVKLDAAALGDAATQGVQVAVADMGGSRVRKLIERTGLQGDEAEKVFSQINSARIDRAQESGQRMSDLIMKQHGSPVMGGNPAEIQAAIKTADAPIIDRVYQIARADPTAQAVTSPKLEALSNSDTVRGAMKKAVSDATDPGSSIRAPTETAHGNLSFWDQVKRNLDDRKATAERVGESAEARRVGTLITGLRDELDAIVPSYKNARDVAAESFGLRNAIELGYESTKRGDKFSTTKKLTDAFQRYTPEQKALYRQGAAAALAETAQASGPQALLKVMDAPQTQKRLIETFGQTGYDTLYGQAQRDHALSNLNIFKAAEPASHKIRDAVSGAVAGAGLSMAGNVAFGANVANALQHGAFSVAGAAALAGGRAILSRAEQRVAPHVMKLLASNDPAVIATLGKESQKPGAVRSFLEKANAAMANAAAHVYIANYKANPPNSAQTDPDRPRRASGGRARKNHAAEADRLVAMVPSFRKAHASQTESLLQMPDTVIAKALAVADGRA